MSTCLERTLGSTGERDVNLVDMGTRSTSPTEKALAHRGIQREQKPVESRDAGRVVERSLQAYPIFWSYVQLPTVIDLHDTCAYTKVHDDDDGT